MLRLSRGLCSMYIPVVGCVFLADTLYGCKYSPHIGVSNLPYVYVKTVLFCTAGRQHGDPNRRYVSGLIEYFVPFNKEQDSQTKLELMQFVDAMLPRKSVTTASPSNATTTTTTSTTGAGAAQLSPSVGTYSLSRNNNNDNNNNNNINNNSSSGNITTSSSSSSSSSNVSPQISENVASFLSGAFIPTALTRVLLYDAICACMDDGDYTDGERSRVSQVAAKLGIPQHVRDAIEKVVVQERQLAMRKRKLLLLTETPPPR